MFLNKRELFTQIIRQQQIVCIEKRHELSARCTQRLVARRAHATILLLDVDNAGREGFEGGLEFLSVGRAVINHYDLIISEALRKNRFQGLADVRRDVVGGHHDANDGRIHGTESILKIGEASKSPLTHKRVVFSFLVLSFIRVALGRNGILASRNKQQKRFLGILHCRSSGGKNRENGKRCSCRYSKGQHNSQG